MAVSKTKNELNFNNASLALEPGDYAIRGFIIDIFSYGNEYPYRIIFNNNTVEEITYFKVNDQMSVSSLDKVNIISNIQNDQYKSETNIFSYLTNNTITWVNNEAIIFNNNTESPCITKLIEQYQCIYTGATSNNLINKTVLFNSNTQPTFNKNFNLLIDHLDQYHNNIF